MTTKKKAVKKPAKKKVLAVKKIVKKPTKKKAVKKVKKTVKKRIVKKIDKITKDMLIGEVVKKYPETIEVFFNYDLHCVGCVAAEFDTIESGAMIHGVNVEYLLFDLNRIIK
jgi:hybrid cluster-associated redox disulfide protein